MHRFRQPPSETRRNDLASEQNVGRIATHRFWCGRPKMCGRKKAIKLCLPAPRGYYAQITTKAWEVRKP